MRGITACLVLIGALAALGILTTGGQAQPQLSISPQEGPPGTMVAITGEGFVAGDTVYVEMFPGTASDHGTISLATVTADDSGRLSIALRMPPEGLGNGGGTGGPFTILAYPDSFGDRTATTVEAAPKTIFTFTPGAPPASGLGPSPRDSVSAYKWALLALGVAVAFAGVAAVFMISAGRRS